MLARRQRKRQTGQSGRFRPRIRKAHFGENRLAARASDVGAGFVFDRGIQKIENLARRHRPLLPSRQRAHDRPRRRLHRQHHRQKRPRVARAHLPRLQRADDVKQNQRKRRRQNELRQRLPGRNRRSDAQHRPSHPREQAGQPRPRRLLAAAGFDQPPTRRRLVDYVLTARQKRLIDLRDFFNPPI